ncbi:MAG: TIGR04348 family glycosyltransferase [Alcaligenaceae bacterium]|nr:MAG: TIGR04348 family glycosyltransferase [Alcaligenaceae bacterium]
MSQFTKPTPKPKLPSVVIVSPALASANNGNWQTAKRYRQMLVGQFRVRLVSEWDGAESDAVLIALHARRSYPSIAAWHAARGSNGLVVVLTGTDLYRDIKQDAQAQQSLQWAARLVVLQATGLAELAAPLRKKTTVLLQSTTPRVTLPKAIGRVRAVMVGHLRPEKAPQTVFEAAALLAAQHEIDFRHIGGEHDLQLAQQARQTAQHYPQYQFMGELSHAATRSQIQRAHVLVHTSIMEGGAHVLMEAICSGVPVIASRIAGNIGMLGEDYAGLFEVGDAQGLATLLLKFKNEPIFATHLQKQCARRAPLFEPAHERSGLITIIENTLLA